MAYARPAPRKSGTGLIVGIILGAVLLFVGCIVGVSLWGIGQFADEILDHLNRNPVIQEHLGEVTEIDFELMKTGEIDNEDTFVFNAKGTKADGLVTVRIDESTQEILEGTLELHGQTYPLVE